MDMNEVLCNTTTSNSLLQDQMKPRSCRILNSSAAVDTDASTAASNKDHPTELSQKQSSVKTLPKESQSNNNNSNLKR